MAETQPEVLTDDDDTYIGERIHTAMWKARITQAQLAAVLGLDQAAVSRRLRGRTAWKSSEVRRAAALLGVVQAEILPPDTQSAAASLPAVSGAHPSHPLHALRPVTLTLVRSA